MDFNLAINSQLIQTIVVSAIGAAGIGVTWYFKKMGTEPFNVWKLIQSGLFGGLFGAFAAITGIVPSEASIEAQLLAVGIFGGGGGIVVENVWKALGLSTLQKAQTVSSVPTTVIGTFDPGFTVTPSFLEGVSPYEAKITVQSGVSAVKLEVEWGDGNVDVVPLNGEPKVMVHKYVYEQGTTKYTGHTFYPKFTVSSMDGQTIPFNTTERGRCCAITVAKQN